MQRAGQALLRAARPCMRSSGAPLRFSRGMASRILYTAESTATGGRNGTAKSSDGALDLKLSMPKGMGGPGGAGTNPEQLFSAEAAHTPSKLCFPRQGPWSCIRASLSSAVGRLPAAASCLAGYAACFLGAMGAAAKKLNKKLPENTTVQGTVHFINSDGQLGLGVALHARSPDLPTGDLQQIVEEAHQICPYSKATQGNINVDLSAEGA